MQTYFSPAKLNLFLNITGKVQDGIRKGYHLIESLFTTVPNLEDEITVEETEGDYSIVIMQNAQGEEIGNYGQNNTAYKAIVKMRQTFTHHAGAHVKVTIKKHIPNGAGLGGSSTNAGTVIKVLAEMWSLEHYFSPKELGQIFSEIGFSIGADVPYFLNPRTALVCGIGEIIQPLKQRLGMHLHTLIIYPGFELSSMAVYKVAPITTFSLPIANGIEVIREQVLYGRNQLCDNATLLAPQISTLLNDLGTQAKCLVARMSGSGSACFAFFEDAASLQNAADFFKHKQPTYFVYSTLLSL
jgi:4-diphosphocytidyl-2-C-methyl-D-erythritol kinase